MNKHEEQLAQELDALLTAQLQGNLPSVAPSELQAESEVANQLLQMANQVEIDPNFAKNLEAQLAARASTIKKQRLKKRPQESPSLGESFIHFFKEGFIMKKRIYAFTAFIALIVVFVAWSVWPTQDSEPTIVANPTEPAVIAGNNNNQNDTNTDNATNTPDVVAVVPDDPDTLPLLPSLTGAGMMSTGRGGGGGGAANETTMDSAISILPMHNPLSGTTYILDTTLSSDPTAATVYTQPGHGLLSLEDLQRFATALGFSSAIYTSVYPQPEGIEGDFVNSTNYFMFDGSRQLSMFDNTIYYFDPASINFDTYVPPLPFAEAAPLAEAYLQERGLLDFPYVMHTNGIDIEFYRLVDGRESLSAEFQVGVNPNGEVWSIGYNTMSHLTALGNYPVRSAQATWQFFLENEVDYQRIFFRTYADPNAEQLPVASPDFDEELYRYWERSYEVGDTIVLYPYLNVFEAVNNDATPRITADQYILIGAENDLRGIAEYANKIISLEGVLREDTNGYKVLEVVTWDGGSYQEFAFREGTISRNGDQVFVNTTEGETILIPDAPADLPDGDRVSVSGWAIDYGDEYPSFNWQSIGRIVEEISEMPFPEEPIAVDSMPVDFMAYRINEVTIQKAELVYAYVPIMTEDKSGPPDFVLQPAWRFSGVTDANEQIEIFVQAIDEALISSDSSLSPARSK